MGFLGAKQRLYASALILGAGTLLLRGIWMIRQGALEVRVLWVSILLIAELPIDAGCFVGSLRWWITNDPSKARIALRLGAAAALLHAVRVMIFVLGRAGPWADFDIHPEYRTQPSASWDRGWLYFAAILAVAGFATVFIIWAVRRRARKKNRGARRIGE